MEQAVQELVKAGKLVRIIPNNGKANHFYISDIYENEMEEESMMTLDRIMANMPMEEREIIMDKMVAASRDILGTIADMGYLDEYETPLTPMEERGYYDEEGNLDIDAVEADGYEFGMDLAFGVLSVCEGKPEHVLEIQKYVNEQYECCCNKKFMKVLETIARMNGNEEVYIEDTPGTIAPAAALQGRCGRFCTLIFIRRCATMRCSPFARPLWEYILRFSSAAIFAAEKYR